MQSVVKPTVWCIQPVVKPVVQRGLTTGWTNSGCSFNMVWQPVVSCKRGITNPAVKFQTRYSRNSRSQNSAVVHTFDGYFALRLVALDFTPELGSVVFVGLLDLQDAPVLSSRNLVLARSILQRVTAAVEVNGTREKAVYEPILPAKVPGPHTAKFLTKISVQCTTLVTTTGPLLLI